MTTATASHWHREAEAYRAHGQIEEADRATKIAESLIPEPQITIVTDDRNPRRRTRLVDPEGTAEYLSAQSAKLGYPCIAVDHGGTVSKNYRYTAYTEILLCVAFPDGRVAVWVDETYAKGSVTERAIVRGVLSDRIYSEACDAFDYRCSNDRRCKGILAIVNIAAAALGDTPDYFGPVQLGSETW